ncbi:CDGSH iron-sulfur domain-containing protein [Candidatus Woesearchaeota archaeon]|nr:CDGSH iron-sulfur domain-containing protein [Candidatus Woesearchaeota archaeon]
MARLVEHDAQGPVEVKAGSESRWICMCGLSKNKPYCDGSHKKTVDEEKGKVYVYDKEGRRTEVQSR